MSILIVDRKGCTVDVTPEVLQVRSAGTLLQSFPIGLLEKIALGPDTLISGGALATLADSAIGVVSFGGRARERAAFITGVPRGDIELRALQIHACNSSHISAQVAKKLVAAKIRGNLRFIGAVMDFRPDLRRPSLSASGTLRHALEKLATVDSLESIRGLEGAAAAAYFKWYAHLFPSVLQFQSRQRRPAPDPVNACLSLGYTLLISEATHVSRVVGLDAAVGFLHRPAHDRPGLACDLVEPFRASVDRMVHKLFQQRALKRESFSIANDGGCYLGKTGRNRFYESWAWKRQRLRWQLLRTARILASALKTETVQDVSSLLKVDIG